MFCLYFQWFVAELIRNFNFGELALVHRAFVWVGWCSLPTCLHTFKERAFCSILMGVSTFVFMFSQEKPTHSCAKTKGNAEV